MAKKTIQDIVEDKYTTFANMIKDIKTKEELDKNLVMYARQKQDLIVQKERDEQLIELKERQGKLSAPYNKMINAYKNMLDCIYRFGHKFDNVLKEELDTGILNYTKQLERVKKAKEDDKELNAIKDMISEINEDFKVIKELELKCGYINWLLMEKFGDGEENQGQEVAQ